MASTCSARAIIYEGRSPAFGTASPKLNPERLFVIIFAGKNK